MVTAAATVFYHILLQKTEWNYVQGYKSTSLERTAIKLRVVRVLDEGKGDVDEARASEPEDLLPAESSETNNQREKNDIQGQLVAKAYLSRICRFELISSRRVSIEEMHSNYSA